jgi:hypothetical protein
MIRAGRRTLTEQQLIDALAAVYRAGLPFGAERVGPPLTIARLCDDHLDPTGLLLGQVREAARKPVPEAKT